MKTTTVIPPAGSPFDFLPASTSHRLRNLAQMADLAQRHPEHVNPASVLRHLRDKLNEIADREVSR